jgi:hypothetical protein
MSPVKSTLRVRPAGVGPEAGASRAQLGPPSARSVFAVRAVEQGVSVETLLLRADGQLQRMPAVFPSRAYAMEQIEQLVRIVHQHFDQLERRQDSRAPTASAPGSSPTESPVS